MRATAGPLAALLAAACAAGCGGQSDEEQVRDTLAAFGAATARQDYRAMCERILAPRLVRTVEEAGLPCEEALRGGFEGVREPRITVGAVRVEGESATAEVRTSAAGQEPSEDTVTLRKTGDGWRIAALAA